MFASLQAPENNTVPEALSYCRESWATAPMSSQRAWKPGSCRQTRQWGICRTLLIHVHL